MKHVCSWGLTPNYYDVQSCVSPGLSLTSARGMDGVKENSSEGTCGASALQQWRLTIEAAHTIDDTKGLAGMLRSSGTPERLLGCVMMGLLISDVRIWRSLHDVWCNR